MFKVTPSRGNVCDLSMETGLCRADFPRWAYNAETRHCRQCKKFSFGGCADAEATPTTSTASGSAPAVARTWCCTRNSPLGEMSSCSRNEACDGRVCHEYPNAACSVDPCTCTPLFVDADGSTVKCLPPPALEAEPITQ